MVPSIGDTAPDFTLPTASAEGPKLITLSDCYRRQNTVLLFFPMVFTDTCSQELCYISQNMPRYAELGATILGISGDNPFAQEAWAKKEGITFPLLSDYDHHVARLYEVAYGSFLPQLRLPMGGVAKRAVFVVDTTGIVRYAECLEDARELPEFDAIVSCLKSLEQPAPATP